MPSEALKSPCHFYIIPVQNVPTDADICHKEAGILIRQSVSEWVIGADTKYATASKSQYFVYK